MTRSRTMFSALIWRCRLQAIPHRDGMPACTARVRRPSTTSTRQTIRTRATSLSLGSGDLAASADGWRMLVGSSRGASVLAVCHPATPLEAPTVHTDGEPYRELDPLYASVGLRMIRDGAEAGKLELGG